MNFQQKIYFSILLIAVIFFLLVLLCILPALRNIVETSSQLALRRQQLASIGLLSQNFEDFEKNFRSYEQGLEEMENLLKQESLIDPEIPISFINFFKEQAAGLNLALKISPTGLYQEGNGFWDYMSFRVDGTGRFTDMMRFVEKLENGRWLVEETSLNITRQEEFKIQSGEGTALMGDYVEINLLIKVYAQG